MSAATHLPVSGGFLGGVGRFIHSALDARREKREAKAWAKALSKGYLDDLVAKIGLPEWMFDESEHVCVCARTEKEAPVIMREYVDQNFADLTECRKEELVAALYRHRWQRWGDATSGARRAEFWERYNAQEAAKAAEFDARRAAQRAQPHRMSREGMRAEAERTFLATGKYALSTGRVLTRNERVQLGLPGGQKIRGHLGLIDLPG